MGAIANMDTSAYDTLPWAIVVCEQRELRILYANRAALTLFACDTLEELLAFTDGQYINVCVPAEREILQKRFREYSEATKPIPHKMMYKILTRTGEKKVVRDDGDLIFGSAFGDVIISALHGTYMEYHTMSDLYDMQHGLVSMKNFLQRANARMYAAYQNGTYEDYHVTYVGIGSFKLYLHQYGMDMREQLLRELAACLYAERRENLIARADEEHFAVFSSNKAYEESYARIRERFSQRHPEIRLHIQAGVYQMKKTGELVEDAYEMAKIVFEQMQSKPCTVAVYDEAMRRRLAYEEYVVRRFEEAMEKDEIIVYFHRIVRALSGKVCMLEASGRWEDPVYGKHRMERLQTILERHYLVEKYDLYMVRLSCKAMRRAKTEKILWLPHFLRVSWMNFLRGDFFQKVVEIIDSYGLPHELFWFETTEPSQEEFMTHFETEITRFRAAGFAVWLGNFGRQWPTIRTMRGRRFDGVKINMKAFPVLDDTTKTVLTSMVSTMKRLGGHIVAQGVTTKEQFDFLTYIGCPRIGGSYVGKGMDTDRAVRFCLRDPNRLESPEERAFYRRLSLVDFSTDRAMAIMKEENGVLSYLFVNEPYKLVCRSIGIWDITEDMLMKKKAHKEPYYKNLAASSRLTVDGAPGISCEVVNGQSTRAITHLLYARDGYRMFKIELANLTVEHELDAGDGLLTAEFTAAEGNILMATFNEIVRRTTEAPNPEEAIWMVLSSVGRALCCSRAYVFELTEGGAYVSNTYEWCADGIASQQGECSRMPLEVFEPWLIEFRAHRSVILADTAEMEHVTPALYKILREGDIRSLIATPLLNGDRVIGFLGFDNPAADRVDSLFPLLPGLGNFAMSLIQRRTLLEKLRRRESRVYLKAIASSYDLMVVYDLMDNTYSIKLDKDYLGFSWPRSGCYDDFLRLLARSHVDKDEKTVLCQRSCAVQRESYLSGKQFLINDTRMRDKDGVIHWSRSRVIYTKAPETGHIIGISMTSIVDDVVAKERARETALQEALDAAVVANEAKSRFLSNISHDIRTPMNAILGYTNIAIGQLHDEVRARDCLDKIRISGRHLQNLINDVLDMARVESGKETVTTEAYSIDLLCNDVLAVISPLIEEKGLHLHKDCDAVTHRAIMADVQKLNRILINILGNSVKFTDAGGTIDVEIRETPGKDDAHGTYTIRMSDTGIGMSQEFCAHVFDTFSRERTSTDSRVIGTGLGMAITKKYVELMGGTISVESKKNVGTTFTVVLPLPFADAKDAEKEQEDTMQRAARLKGKHVLLVEDNAMNREIAKYILERIGMVVDTANDGKVSVDKMEAAADGAYDVILMDMQMPIMDGVTATKAIRASERTYLRRVPIIALTANAFLEDVEKCIMAGMNDHVAKPFNEKDLVEKMLYLCADGAR